MLEIKDIPNFKWVLFHSGNTDENTAGCILVGDTQQDLDVSKDGFIGASRNAYKKMYDKIAVPMVNGEKVTLRVSSINLSEENEISNKSQDTNISIPMVMAKLGSMNADIKQIKAGLKGKQII